MARFEYNDYDNRCVMHCPTLESAQIFLRHLDSLGKCWCSGDRYTELNNWNEYEDETCYGFVDGEFSDLDWYECEGFTILEFDDFEWDNFPDNIEPAMSFDEMFYGVAPSNQTTI